MQQIPFVTFISDCAGDHNGAMRLSIQGHKLFGTTPSVFHARTDQEAAGMLIDALHIAGDAHGIILVNVAPRGDQHTHQNGVPFGCFRVRNVVVKTTLSPAVLALIARFGIAEHIEVLDIPAVVEWAVGARHISPAEGAHMRDTQFRSLYTAPVMAKWWADDLPIPSTRIAIKTLAAPAESEWFWYVDCFGNCKSTLTRNTLATLQKQATSNQLIARPVHKKLADIPNDGNAYWIEGSSGWGENKCMELVVKGVDHGGAAALLGIRAGDAIQA